MECGAHHPAYNRGWTPCCHSSQNKRCPGCGSPGCRCACPSTAACSPAPPPPDRWCLTAVSERWKPRAKWTETNIQSSSFPDGAAVTVKRGALSRDVQYLPRRIASSLFSSEDHTAPSGFRIPLQECKDNQGWCLLALLPSCRKWWASQHCIQTAPSPPQPQLHTYLHGHTLSLFVVKWAVFLVRKRLWLSQIQHGLDHHLQWADAPRPTPPWSFRGVRGDVAGNAMLKEEADMLSIKTIPSIFYPRNQICKEADWISTNPIRTPCVSEWISRSFLYHLQDSVGEHFHYGAEQRI